MTAKEKAKYLVQHFDLCNQAAGSFITPFQVKQCALFTVNEILNSGHGWNKTTSSFVKYWQQVIQQIEKL